MVDVNLALKKAYKTALWGISYNSVTVKCFLDQLPSTVAPGVYIIFRPVTDTDNSAKTASMHIALMSVSVYTNNQMYNDGIAIDTVANSVLQAIYPHPRYNITLTNTNLQVVATYKYSDRTNNFSVEKQLTYVDREIIFRHRIFENPS